MMELLRRALRRLETFTASSLTTAGSALGHHYGDLSHPSLRG